MVMVNQCVYHWSACFEIRRQYQESSTFLLLDIVNITYRCFQHNDTSMRLLICDFDLLLIDSNLSPASYSMAAGSDLCVSHQQWSMKTNTSDV